jgi:hypothetical protein
MVDKTAMTGLEDLSKWTLGFSKMKAIPVHNMDQSFYLRISRDGDYVSTTDHPAQVLVGVVSSRRWP